MIFKAVLTPLVSPLWLILHTGRRNQPELMKEHAVRGKGGQQGSCVEAQSLCGCPEIHADLGTSVRLGGLLRGGWGSAPQWNNEERTCTC